MSRFSILGWPVFRQAKFKDKLGRGPTVESHKEQNKGPQTEYADKVVQSVYTYYDVGFQQRIYVKSDTVTHMKSDTDTPISRSRLCPKGAASEQLINTQSRQKTI